MSICESVAADMRDHVGSGIGENAWIFQIGLVVDLGSRSYFLAISISSMIF